MTGGDSSSLRLAWLRRELLRALPADGIHKDALASRLDVTRSTVDRAVDSLAAADVVVDAGGRVEPRLPASLVTASLDRFEAYLDDLSTAQSVLDPLSADVPMDEAMVRGARVVRSTPDDAGRAHVPVRELLARATHVDVFSPQLPTGHIPILEERIVDGRLSMRVVTTNRIVEQLLSNHRAYLTSVFRAESYRIKQTDDVPYALLVVETPTDEHAGVVVYEDDRLHGFLGNDNPDAVDWARATFETYWRHASPLPDGQFD
jgi:hypothetical protein